MAVPPQVRSLRLLLATILCAAAGAVVAPAAVAGASHSPGVDAGDKRHPVAGHVVQGRTFVLVAKRTTGDDLPPATSSTSALERRSATSYFVDGLVVPVRGAAGEAASARAPPSGGRFRS